MTTPGTSSIRIPLTTIPLGDVRAELDHAMLAKGFLETQDYRTLLEIKEGKVVVGRRGTGKSALMYRFTQHWGADKSLILIALAPDEDQVIGIRPLLSAFGSKFTHIRAGVRILWTYCVMMELVERISTKYKVSAQVSSSELLSQHLKQWRAAGSDFFSRLRTTIRSAASAGIGPEDQIGNLASRLKLRELQREMRPILDEGKVRCVVIVDRLDEGYEFDTVGVALIDGVIHGMNELEANAAPHIKGITFLRDNIFRAIALNDPDFSRSIEGQALRLHWDTYQLFNLVCNRLRTVYYPDIENNQRLWDRCTANELQHQAGFRKCLQLTLYRPRDILLLLNQAFYNAARENRIAIIPMDIESSAKSISINRLEDLHKEYGAIFPGLPNLTTAFAGCNPELSAAEAQSLLEPVLSRDDFTPEVQQDFALFRSPAEQLRNLYSVGFVGVHDKEVSGFVFCHDGRQPDRDFQDDNRILIHPCYWLALNLSRSAAEPEEVSEINDEYDIEVTSLTPQIRKQKLGQMIAELDQIPTGTDGAQRFEEWCEQAIRVVFAGQLRNIHLHPNKDAVQRRDVVATNLSTKGAWKRIYDDYKVRHAIFEIKNYANIGLDEYRQMLSYLTDKYGTLGFIITRDESQNLERGKGLEHFLEMYNKHGQTIVRLNGRLLCTMLSKMRNPQKHDEPDHLLSKILNTYELQYLSGVTAHKDKSKGKGKRKK